MHNSTGLDRPKGVHHASNCNDGDFDGAHRSCSAVASRLSAAARPGRKGIWLSGAGLRVAGGIPDKRVIFRVFSPKAEDVRLVGTDIPRNTQGLPMSRGDNGVWEATVGPLDPGAYRYHFNVNGVAVIDPRSPAISESNNNVWSLVHIPDPTSWTRATCPTARSQR